MSLSGRAKNFCEHIFSRLVKPSPDKRNYYNCGTSLARGNKSCFLKGISLSASFLDKGKVKGSMTVEAAVVLPVLLFFFWNLTAVMELLCLHGRLEMALWETGNRMAVYGYAYKHLTQEDAADAYSEPAEERTVGRISGSAEVRDGGMTSGIAEARDGGMALSSVEGGVSESIIESIAALALTNIYARNEVIGYLGEDYLDSLPLTWGSDGLNFLESELTEDDCIDLKVTYQISSPVPVPGFPSFRMANRYYGRAWTGYEIAAAEENSEGIQNCVYITEYGEVYHESRQCRYLQVYIIETDAAEVWRLRNGNGERYTACWRCPQREGTRLFITPEGIRYHYTVECPALKRNIRTIDREQAQNQGYRPCSRCGDRE